MKHISVPRVVVVAAALGIAASAIPDDHDVTNVPPTQTRTIRMIVVNNTTTPAQGPNHPMGYLRVKCIEGVVPGARTGRKTPVNCHGLGENPFDFWYQARLADAEDGTRQFHSATILVDCESSGKVELTGSGAGITAQVTCTDPN